jgi:hypothetical protein
MHGSWPNFVLTVHSWTLNTNKSKTSPYQGTKEIKWRCVEKGNKYYQGYKHCKFICIAHESIWGIDRQLNCYVGIFGTHETWTWSYIYIYIYIPILCIISILLTIAMTDVYSKKICKKYKILQIRVSCHEATRKRLETR